MTTLMQWRAPVAQRRLCFLLFCLLLPWRGDAAEPSRPMNSRPADLRPQDAGSSDRSPNYRAGDVLAGEAGGPNYGSGDARAGDAARPKDESVEAAADAARPVGFSARWDHRWQMRKQDSSCELTLEVGAFGQARFLAQPGAALNFELIERQPLLAPNGVSARAVAPSWHPRYPHASRWAPLAHVPGYGIQLDRPEAVALLMSLYEGYEQELGAAGLYGTAPALLLTLSVLDFRSAYDAFLRCQQHQRPASLLALHRTRVQFATGKHQIPPAALARIREVAAYVARDPRVVRVYVDGYTDDVGGDRDNVALSKRRAGAVADALSSAGVERSLLAVRYHGERYPVLRAKSSDARAKNRRTTVRVELGTSPAS
jgi:outer membrane protein OmpA-like peptidoglycan-associated protein